jgi:formyl-CoA transferase
MGNQHPSIAPYETLAAADGHLAVACGNDAQFGRLATVLGAGHLAADERFATNSARVAHRTELVAALEAALAGDTVQAWIKRLSDVGVPAGAVGSIADAFALADRLGLDPTVDVGPDAPRQVRNPITFSRTPVSGYAAPPRLGEHNDDIRQWLTEETSR